MLMMLEFGLLATLLILPEAFGYESHLPISRAVHAFNNSINVRTVLFRDTDACKLCWSRDELNLLVARRLVQDLIPRRVPKDFPALLTYLNSVVETIRAKTPEKFLYIMLLATYDALGGYLHAVVIPVLNEAFYAGNVDYATTSGLHSLLGTMMHYLGTNGQSWAPPCDMRKIPTKVAALPIRICKTKDACDAFVIPHVSRTNKTEELCPDHPTVSGSESKIQIPFLDDNAYPSAVAVPLKDHPLFSLMSECAVNIIPKYYILAMRCLSSANFSSKDIITFNKLLHRWIIASVVPHLHETDRWYPGFGSVMRVVETMNQRGLASADVIKPDVKESNDTICVELNDKTCRGLFGLPFWMAILLLLLLALLALALCCCLIRCICGMMRQRRSSFEEDDSTLVNTLVNLYCGIKMNDEEKKRVLRSGSSRTSVEEMTTEDTTE